MVEVVVIYVRPVGVKCVCPAGVELLTDKRTCIRKYFNKMLSSIFIKPVKGLVPETKKCFE